MISHPQHPVLNLLLQQYSLSSEYYSLGLLSNLQLLAVLYALWSKCISFMQSTKEIQEVSSIPRDSKDIESLVAVA